KAELIKWEPTDSVMEALLKRPNFQATKYQGATVRFDARKRDLTLTGKPAGVQRVRALLVGDTVVYNDSTQMVTANGPTVTLRDPDQSSDDLVSKGGRLKYDITEGRGVAAGLETSVDNKGASWIVYGHLAALRSREDTTATDSTERKVSTFYAEGGQITSCTDSTPHYHFSAGQMKVVSNGFMVGRPAVLYLADIPVAWLPFIFQDMRKGRRSGVLVPRLGASELLRNSATYQRTVENMGYYFALNDYMDATLWADYRSDARPPTGGFGFYRLSGDYRYRWLSRFITGGIGVSYLEQGDGLTSLNFHWNHSQQFSQSTSPNTNLNYVSHTTVQRNTTLDPRIVLGSIQSQINYTKTMGPLNLALGGSQTQYPGRSQVNRSFPSLNLSSRPIELASWLTWTPAMSLANDQGIDLDQQGTARRYVVNAAGAIDSVPVKQSTRDTRFTMQSPLKIGNFQLQLGASLTDQSQDFPTYRDFVDVNDTTIKERRYFNRTYQSAFDFQVGFSLPSLFASSWKVTPSITLQNVDGSAFFVRNERTGGAWVGQSKKLVYALSISPTFFGLFNGFGSVTRFRHSLQPTIQWNYAPASSVSDEFLAALGKTRPSYLGSLAQNGISIGLAQNLEAKIRSEGDTGEGKKVRLLSLTMSSFNYNFEQYKEIKRRHDLAGTPAPSWTAGLTTDRFELTARSDLLPGFDLGIGWSLFQGSVQSDTAVFKPYNESIRASLQLDRASPLIQVARRLLGMKEAPPEGKDAAGPGQSTQSQQVSGMAPTLSSGSVIGGSVRPQVYDIPSGQGWRLSLTFSSTKTRPPVGGNVITIDPLVACQPLLGNPVAYDQCRLNPQNQTPTNPVVGTTLGGPVYLSPPQTNMQFQYSFNLTPKWAAMWSSSYDFEKQLFAAQVVSLQRDMHDWKATFSFTQAPNGNASFSFFISLKAEPEIKFNYDRATLATPTAR
ncbi:MAG: LPS-assembly protein LptD, partial [Gemmatimonadetes bacterium]|nr:LPS-assembly protein LptD [Gemmatimonadota bacterium]